MMDSDNDTYEEYLVEFDDEPPLTQLPERILESPVHKSQKSKAKSNGTTPKKKETPGFMCRICLKRCSKQSRKASDFAETYLKCTGFSFEDGQEPTKLCYPCINELQKVENFIEKCSETEEKLSKGVPLKDTGSESDDFSEISDVDVVFEGEEDEKVENDEMEQEEEDDGSDESYKPEKEKKVKGKRGRPRVEKVKPDPTLPRIERRGRPPLDPSQRKPKVSKGPRGRPKGTFKLKDECTVIRPIGRPKNSFKVKEELSTTVPVMKPVIEKTDHQICFMCGKLVRAKQISYHLWKHRKDEEVGATTSEPMIPSSCEFCHTTYKSKEHLKSHMKRLHPAVAYGMPDEHEDSSEPEEKQVDNFDEEFHVPTPKQEEYPQIQSPYTHVQALHYLQKGGRR